MYSRPGLFLLPRVPLVARAQRFGELTQEAESCLAPLVLESVDCCGELGDHTQVTPSLTE